MAHAHLRRDRAGEVTTQPQPAGDVAGMLREADDLLALMGSEALGVVADLADGLSASANYAGVRQIAEAASAVSRIATGRQAAALAGAMHDLTAAITRARDGQLADS